MMNAAYVMVMARLVPVVTVCLTADLKMMHAVNVMAELQMLRTVVL
jgi:hypothetical protein